MSTNYYFEALSGPLAPLGEVHIGKRSGGWEFMFQGFAEEGGERRVDVNNSGLTISVNIPRLVVKSRKEWFELLKAHPVVIRNEYSEEITLAEFESIVESLAPGKFWKEEVALMSHYEHLLKDASRYGKIDDQKDWRDAEGFSFCSADFS